LGLFFLFLILASIFVIISNFTVGIKFFKYKKRYFLYLKILNLFNIAFVIDAKNQLFLRQITKKGKIKKTTIRSIPDINKDFISAVFKSTKIKKIVISCVIGTSEAKNTALICFAFNFLLDFVLTKLLKIKSKINISPEFTKENFTIDTECILKINFVNSIIKYLINLLKKVVKKYESDSGSYANNNG